MRQYPPHMIQLIGYTSSQKRGASLGNMAHFAKIKDGIVKSVIVVSNADCIDEDGNESDAAGVVSLASFGIQTEGFTWKRTSYNTFSNKHEAGGVPFRKNYAGVGYTYDEERNAFIAPKRFPSWNLDEDTCCWVAPVPYPEVEIEEGVPPQLYSWNEENQTWDEVEMPSND